MRSSNIDLFEGMQKKGQVGKANRIPSYSKDPREG